MTNRCIGFIVVVSALTSVVILLLGFDFLWFLWLVVLGVLFPPVGVLYIVTNRNYAAVWNHEKRLGRNRYDPERKFQSEYEYGDG